MTTSNSFDFTYTAQELVTDALRKLAVIRAEEEPTKQAMADGLRQLELLLKTLSAQYQLWRLEEATVFTEIGRDIYNFTGDVTGARAIVEGSDINTTATADIAGGALGVTVASSAGILDGYIIGIRVNTRLIHWTRVVGDPIGNNVTIADPTPEPIPSGGKVIAYAEESIIIRPLRIEQVRRRIADQDTEVYELSRDDYFMLPNKLTESIITQWYYDPSISVGRFYAWPTGDTVDTTLRMTYVRPLMDVDDKTNQVDLPQEWWLGLVYTLAVTIAPDYGKRVNSAVSTGWQYFTEMLEAWDSETASMQFSPDYRDQ